MGVIFQNLFYSFSRKCKMSLCSHLLDYRQGSYVHKPSLSLSTNHPLNCRYGERDASVLPPVKGTGSSVT